MIITFPRNHAKVVLLKSILEFQTRYHISNELANFLGVELHQKKSSCELVTILHDYASRNHLERKIITHDVHGNEKVNILIVVDTELERIVGDKQMRRRTVAEFYRSKGVVVEPTTDKLSVNELRLHIERHLVKNLQEWKDAISLCNIELEHMPPCALLREGGQKYVEAALDFRNQLAKRV